MAGSPGGTGGAAGEGGDGVGGWGSSWLLDEEAWRELPELADPLAEVRAWEGVREKFQFPALRWQSCGEACEQAVFGESFESTWSSSLGQVSTDRGLSVWIAFTQPLGNGEFRRIVDLSNGETIATLRLDHESGTLSRQDAQRGTVGYFKSAMTMAAFSKDVALIGTFDPTKETWDFKLPWNDGQKFGSGSCLQFDVDTSPPTFFAGCGHVVRATLESGSAQMTPLSEGAVFLDGSGLAGLAAWSEIFEFDQHDQFVRVVTWSPDAGMHTVMDRFDGDVCGVGVGKDRVVGFRASGIHHSYGCTGRLLEPEFWWVSRDGGEVHGLPIKSLKGFGVARSVTWGDYAAAMIVKSPVRDREDHHHRFATLLIRISDGAVREIPLRPLHFYGQTAVALDDDYLYVGETAYTDHDNFGSLRRYRLAEFEKLGREPVDVAH